MNKSHELHDGFCMLRTQTSNSNSKGNTLVAIAADDEPCERVAISASKPISKRGFIVGNQNNSC